MSTRDFPADDSGNGSENVREGETELVMRENMPRVVGEESVLGTVIREEDDYRTEIWSTVTVEIQP